jgi:hypothetical protein
MIYAIVNITLSLMISASKSTLRLNNLKSLRHKAKKNLTNLHKKFCESPPRTINFISLLKLVAFFEAAGAIA